MNLSAGSDSVKTKKKKKRNKQTNDKTKKNEMKVAPHFAFNYSEYYFR